jgi:hypothetical protein
METFCNCTQNICPPDNGNQIKLLLDHLSNILVMPMLAVLCTFDLDQSPHSAILCEYFVTWQCRWIFLLKVIKSVIGHGIGGILIPAKMAQLAESQSLE